MKRIEAGIMALASVATGALVACGPETKPTPTPRPTQTQSRRPYPAQTMTFCPEASRIDNNTRVFNCLPGGISDIRVFVHQDPTGTVTVGTGDIGSTTPNASTEQQAKLGENIFEYSARGACTVIAEVIYDPPKPAEVHVSETCNVKPSIRRS